VTRRAVRQTRYERGSAGAGVGRNPVMVALGHVTTPAPALPRSAWCARPASLQDQLGAVAKAVGALKPWYTRMLGEVLAFLVTHDVHDQGGCIYKK
jgi:hypothetical protein